MEPVEAVLVKIASAGLIGEAMVYAVAFAGACLHYRQARRGTRRASLRSFIRHLLPRDLVFARWTRLDIAYAVLDKLLMGFVLPSVAAMVVLASQIARTGFGLVLGAGPGLPETALSLALFLIAGLLARDFAAFYVHLMQHRIPLLWEFHKVHHAPESLVPPTSRRLHPIDQFLGMIAEVPLLGIIVGAYAWLARQDLDALIPCAVGFYTLANIVTFAPLRHSHIDLRLGAFERFLLSPAHHRLHHSVEPAHWDKNFAAIFPIWDRLFGTLFAPPPAACYRLGLPDGDSVRYATLARCYLEPFRAIRRGLRRHGARHMLRVGPLAGQRGGSGNTDHERVIGRAIGGVEGGPTVVAER
jgi:sterol desaturase/sphingolipid hydroxylase (fatty acid hydroxylase superfamily)